jgi:hypothetical protein
MIQELINGLGQLIQGNQQRYDHRMAASTPPVQIAQPPAVAAQAPQIAVPQAPPLLPTPASPQGGSQGGGGAQIMQMIAKMFAGG